MLLNGIFPSITTQFYPDGNVYFKKIEHNVERYSKTPAAGLVALGSTGEAVVLSDDERREGIEGRAGSYCAEQGLDRGHWHRVGCRNFTAHRVCGWAWIRRGLVGTPHFYKRAMQPANLLAFYRTVADLSPLPVLIYNVPPFTGYDMPAELVWNPRGIRTLSGSRNRAATWKKYVAW